MDEVDEPLFRCSITTWMEKALPVMSPKVLKHPDIYTPLTMESLSKNADYPLLDSRGFVPLHELATQPRDSVSSHSLNDALDYITTGILHCHDSAIYKQEDGQHELAPVCEPLFQPLKQEPKDYCVPDDLYGVKAVSILSLDDTDFEESNDHLTEVANKIMFEDPCRRYLYGLTINGSMTTFWRFDRTSILMSEEFDCQQRPDILIRFVVSLGLSDKAQLGFDPTVSVAAMHTSNGGIPGPAISTSFIYWLGGRRYRTIGPPIYTYSASFMCSSGVRVWVVKEVDENGSWLATAQEHILKDFWAEDDHVSDMEHQDAIKKRLCELDVDGGDRAQEMEKYFMKIRHDEAVMIDEKPDIALAIPNDAAWVDLGVEQVLITTRYQKGNFRIRRPLRLAPRIHHRLLYEEKCMRITDCTDLNVVLDCLKQFCIALDLFRQAEYVHRDISSGNCLVLERNGSYQAKISDLQFCKDYRSISPMDPVKGTPEFMATEARKKLLSWVHRDKAPDAYPTYHYHPLYDLESLYWVFIWFIFSREPIACDLPLDDDVYYDWDKQLRRIFDRSADLWVERQLLFLHPGQRDYMEWLETMELLGWPAHDVADPIFDLFLEWQKVYIQLENTPQDAATHRWPISCISNSMYCSFDEMLTKVGSNIGKGPFHVRSIRRKLENHQNSASMSSVSV